MLREEGLSEEGERYILSNFSVAENGDIFISYI